MKLPCLLLLTISITTAYAQEERVPVSGKVVSSDGGQPITYASVRLMERGTGTVTNDSGSFFLWAPRGRDTVVISHLGYKTRWIAQSDVKGMVVLEKEPVEMREVVVGDPLEIILKAVDRIPENYLTIPYVTKGFYRTTAKKEKQYGFLSESLFDIYNYAFADQHAPDFRLVKHREFKDTAAMENITIGSRPEGIEHDDIVRNLKDGDMKVFTGEGPKYYDYTLDGIVDVGGRRAYQVSFDQKDGLKESRLKGSVFIDVKSYAFLYFDFGKSPKGLQYDEFPESAAKRTLLKLLGITLKRTLDHRTIAYRPIGKKWVLSDVTQDLHWYYKTSKNGPIVNLYPAAHYVVTDVDTTPRPFAAGEIMRRTELIEDEATDEDSLFWKDYTIILPDFPEQPVIRHIKASNAVRQVRVGLEARLRKMPRNTAERIDTILSVYHAHGLFNGTALVSWKGSILVDKGYGYANRERHRSADGGTGYRIGSTSKTFTSVIINQLVAEGKLRLDTPIRAYLPDYVNGGLTIDQLLTHKSGVHNLTESDDFMTSNFAGSLSLKEVVKKYCSDTLDFPAGTQFSYSNSGFVLLALIAQEVTGKPFDQLLQERIFGPLKMDHSYVGMRQTDGEATGYLDGRPEARYDARNLMGAGGIVSTADDLFKYSEGLRTLLPPDRFQDMLKPRATWDEYKAYYDYGWMTDREMFGVSGNKNIVTYHPGTDAGFFTMFARQDDRDATIILLNNTGDFPRFEMTDLILNELNR
ncbi:MAG TPA: serine hydrolase [Dinghuibacter sp.]|uniref:serine hydrolase n=1 Tax=Dinghuibacter sp. TaxID=2024697 RepID=UPI002C180DD3|nr:serine hydrolase [Dinghuibacter sp.]HTJ12120.1 serine hydrolase [Dinghuibacter sp.]